MPPAGIGVDARVSATRHGVTGTNTSPAPAAPAGSTAGQKLRLRGQGLPREDGGRGDLYAVLEIEVPPEVGLEERKLWEKLAAESRWRPGARG